MIKYDCTRTSVFGTICIWISGDYEELEAFGKSEAWWNDKIAYNLGVIGNSGSYLLGIAFKEPNDAMRFKLGIA